MASLNPNKKWIVIIIVFLLVTALVIYLNRSYAHIYQKNSATNLKPLAGNGVYVINNMATKESLVYTALGDSLTYGLGTDREEETFPYLLSQNLAQGEREIILNNRSRSGAETKDLVVDFLPAAIKDNPDIVTLLIGVNDLHNRVSPAEFKKDYEEILSRLVGETKATVYAISIPFIGANDLMRPPYQYFFDLRTKEFNEIIKKLTDRYAVKYVDLYSPTVELFKQSGAHYSSDSFHPSAAGYKIWADIIYADLNQ